MIERALLFVPGDRPERFAKAAGSGADLVILDLEDAVPEDRKTAARDEVVRWLGGGSGRGAVRINAVGTSCHEDDVGALAGLSGLQAVVVPKANDPEALTQISRACGAPVIALVETAGGVLRAAELATAEGVCRLAFGHLDFAADIDAEPSGATMDQARAMLVLASRAADLPGPIDGVTTNLDDAAVAEADARRARRLGFAGKLCIHPRQVAAIRQGFRPTAEAVGWARQVIEATESDGGAVRVDGQLVDAPVIARARAILAEQAAAS